MAHKSLLKMFNTSVSKTTVSIVGTAGRKEDAIKMSRELYEKMVQKAEQVITQQLNLDLSQTHLVSGGAAWAGMYECLRYCVSLLIVMKQSVLDL